MGKSSNRTKFLRRPTSHQNAGHLSALDCPWKNVPYPTDLAVSVKSTKSAFLTGPASHKERPLYESRNISQIHKSACSILDAEFWSHVMPRHLHSRRGSHQPPAKNTTHGDNPAGKVSFPSSNCKAFNVILCCELACRTSRRSAKNLLLGNRHSMTTESTVMPKNTSSVAGPSDLSAANGMLNTPAKCCNVWHGTWAAQYTGSRPNNG